MCLHAQRACVYMCEEVMVQAGVSAAGRGEGRGSRCHRKTFVRRLLPCSQLEFHLFPHQNEMALIVGSDVWWEGGAGKQGK